MRVNNEGINWYEPCVQSIPYRTKIPGSLLLSSSFFLPLLIDLVYKFLVAAGPPSPVWPKNVNMPDRKKDRNRNPNHSGRQNRKQELLEGSYG
jgi:hypothetical protein